MSIYLQLIVFITSGILVGVAASFTGLGGGFLIIPLLLFLGFTAQKAVGTSLLAIVIVSLSAVTAHGRLANVDYKTALLIGVGGIIGAQIGAHLVQYVSTENFRKIFACILMALAIYLFIKK